ncbi:MAG: hypothetical protein PHF86_13800 [Candidatus Nanoarchaeia archaeon]|nr:hypothetical protein [Candidatus Nanoarchaeia archaeon]
MKNRNVGFLIIGLALIIGIIVFLFNNAMTTIVSTSCSHGPSCTMYDTIETQTYISIAIIGLIFIIGLFFVFAKEAEKIILKTRTIKAKRKEVDTSKLEADERNVVKLLQAENGAIFQSTLKEKLNLGKVGMTRLLDKLEAKQIIERKRRGMNNIVVLK